MFGLQSLTMPKTIEAKLTVQQNTRKNMAMIPAILTERVTSLSFANSVRIKVWPAAIRNDV